MAGRVRRRSLPLESRLKLLAALALPVAGFVMLNISGGQDSYAWWALHTRGVDTTGVIASRTLKHCGGLRCSSPSYFSGTVGGDEYRRFVDNCGRACWWLVDVDYRNTSGARRSSQSVDPVAFEALAPGTRVTVRFDPRKGDRAVIVGRTETPAEIFAFILIWVCLAALALIVGLSVLRRCLNRLSARYKRYSDMPFWLRGR